MYVVSILSRLSANWLIFYLTKVRTCNNLSASMDENIHGWFLCGHFLYMDNPVQCWCRWWSAVAYNVRAIHNRQ